eukprot:TRINITY_DN14134_c0_g1_i1.p1 TRINITY_DN14134_c0_g1~~TRINITY_DN14134_c0_g1_i1.p1  ORF type:complete len:504 (-),score=145.29 TRINITY_DN14134_c0_g1_i1:288-1799(-)
MALKLRGDDSHATVVPASGRFPSDTMGVSFYKEPVGAEMSVREFEELTIGRLNLLHAFDRVCGYDTALFNIPDMKGKMQKDFSDANLLLQYPSGANLEKCQEMKRDFLRRDITSHYALRMAFCKTRDSREWFIKQEQRLFLMRFDSLAAEAKEAFLAASGVKCRKFVGEGKDFEAKLKLLQQCTPGAKNFQTGSGGVTFEKNFYEMPFFEVHPSLLSSRKVVVQGGKAYVPSSALQLILVGKFKECLNAALDAAFQGLPDVLADPRVGGFLRIVQDHGMQLGVAPKPKNTDGGVKLSLDNFNELLVTSFPPCMRLAVEHQRERKKHLKHSGRLQLRPFLKDVGFTIEESMRWWKEELTKDPEITVTVFEKNYTYDVEHTYGKKGNFQGQNAFGCAKIIGFPGAVGNQVHGCPFKQLDVPHLRQLMHKWKISENSMTGMEKLINNGKHYQLACIEYFKAKHPGHDGDGVGNNPSDFFRESCKCHAKDNTKNSPEKSKSAVAPAA